MTAENHEHPQNHGLPAMEPVDVAPLQKIGLIAAVVGLALFLILGGINMSAAGEFGIRDFFFAYLSGWVYWGALPFGAMTLLMIGYLTSASWGIVLRRCFQAATRTLPLIAILFIPIVLSWFLFEGKQSPYWWADHSWHGDIEAVAKAKHLRPEAVEEAQHKIHDFLNPTFVLGWTVFTFVVLGGIIYCLNTWSKPAEDSDDQAAKDKLYTLSGPAIIAWALILTVALTFWVMSVEPTWASSMFPVIYGMNAFICTFGFSVFTFYYLNANKADVMAVIKEKFRIDMGTLLFGFTMVWAYGSFCQYMLVWAGNLPEEVSYYRKRGDHGWHFLAMILMAFHWLIPFVLFLFRELKTNPRTMKMMVGLLMTVCALDVIWWLLPAVPHEHTVLHFPMAVAAIVGVGGIWILEFTRQLKQRPILPANDEGKFLANWGHHH